MLVYGCRAARGNGRRREATMNLNEMTTENLVTLAAEAFEANDDAQAAFVAVELRFRGAQMEAEDIEDTLSIRAIGSTLRTAGDWAHGGNVTSTAKAWLEAGFTAAEVEQWLAASPVM